MDSYQFSISLVATHLLMVFTVKVVWHIERYRIWSFFITRGYSTFSDLDEFWVHRLFPLYVQNFCFHTFLDNKWWVMDYLTYTMELLLVRSLHKGHPDVRANMEKVCTLLKSKRGFHHYFLNIRQSSITNFWILLHELKEN